MTVQITIIGMGQIGTSIGLALAQHKGLVYRVGHDKDLSTANQAKSLGALDRVDINIPHAVEEAGLVILALPLDQAQETLKALSQDLREEAVVMDMAPIKDSVLTWAKEMLPAKRYYVGITPVINPKYLQTHDSGPQAAHADLFHNGLLAIISPRGTPSEAIKLAADLSGLLGAEHMFIDPVELDSLMAATHILPELMAAALLNTTVDQPGWREARMLTGRPFAEAAGPAVLYDQSGALIQAALSAREHVVRNLDHLIDHLNHLRQDIYSQDTTSLTLYLENARKGYERWWSERNTANWGAIEIAPKVEIPTVKDIFGRMVGMRRKKDQPDLHK
jgi:prephenate dehydrogenase